jgi:hypothetical protein
VGTVAIAKIATTSGPVLPFIVSSELKESGATLERGELNQAVLEDLEEELDGSETTEDARKLMREMVDEALGIE